MRLGKITTGERSQKRNSKRVKATTIEADDDSTVKARVELDTRADTSCLGANFRYVSDRGEVCNVNGFHGEFDTLQDVPIVRGVTGWKDPSTGKPYLLFINQGLWFGEKLDHSLLNPNQVRHFGISVSDNKWDESKKFGIDHDDVYIPFTSEGATVYFDTFRPSLADLEDKSFIHIELTDGIREWDPHKVVMGNQPHGNQNSSIQAIDIETSEEGKYYSDIDVHLAGVSGSYVPRILSDRIIKSAVIRPDIGTAGEDLRNISKVARTPRDVNVQEAFSTNRHNSVTPERVGKIFGISLDRARWTLHTTTQSGMTRARQNRGPMNRRFPRSNIRFQSEEPKLAGKFYMDWVTSNVKSIHNETGAFFIGDGRYVDCYPRPKHTSEDATDALASFITDVGTPASLKVDSAAEFVGKSSDFVKFTKRRGVNVSYAEPYRHEIGRIDVQIREAKKKWQEDKCNKQVPRRLWNYGIKHATQVMQVTPMEGERTGYEEVTGKTPDISELLDFEFYDLVWFWNEVHPSLGDDAKDLGRWLGNSKKVGTGMTYFVIKKAAKYWRTKNKFGIELPHSVEEALALDKKNGNTFWRDALKKEMGNVRIAFHPEERYSAEDVRKRKAKHLIAFTEIKCHVVFDVKMDFTRKARFVAGGHLTDAPACMTYSSVVSRDSVRLAFMIAALNGLEVSATDVGNAYLNAECREKVWFQAGLECGEEDEGKVMIITRALYGLKSSGAAWRAMFSDFIINQLGFSSTIVDQDVYRRKSFYKDENGVTVPYYELLLVYVDDVLLVSKSPNDVMDKIGKTFRLKEGYGKPTTYLGAEVFQHRDTNNRPSWALGSGKYVKNVVTQVKAMLNEDGESLKPYTKKERSHLGPIHPDYHPELESSDLLGDDLHSRYQQIIGMLRWAVELGRIDIQVDVAIMSQYLAAPRIGHLEAVYGIVRYLDQYPDRRLVMSAIPIQYPDDVENGFNHNADWKDFYGEMVEEDPAGMPVPLGEAVKIRTYLDADHAGNVVTRRSHTGILIFVNNSLIVQYSKKQNTVESATFGAEMVAMRVARDLTVALRIKLKMFGVPIDGPADFFCDNDSVVKNTSIPTSLLAKKHNSVNYHIIRESAAAGILRVAKIPTEYNYSDALTKILPLFKRIRLLNPLLYMPSECNIIEDDTKASGES